MNNREMTDTQQFHNSVLNFNNGRHLTLDAIIMDGKEVLNNADLGNLLLEEIIKAIDMTMILPPVTVKFPHAICEMQRVLEGLEKEGLQNSQTYQMIENSLRNRKLQTYGYSTVVIIAESHLSFHTFPEDNYFTFDCYSCKYFDQQKVAEIFNHFFSFRKVNWNLIKRGINDEN